MITERQRTVFETSDGEEFLTKEAAIAHERKVAIDDFVGRHGICSGGPWSPDMVADVLYEHSAELLAILRSGM